MNAQKMFEVLKGIPKEERKELKMFFRVAPPGIAFNVKEVDQIQK